MSYCDKICRSVGNFQDCLQFHFRKEIRSWLICCVGWFLGDADSDNSLVEKTLLSDYTSIDGTITSQPEWLGKKRYFAQFFVDDYGSFEDASIGGLFEIGIIRILIFLLALVSPEIPRRMSLFLLRV